MSLLLQRVLAGEGLGEHRAAGGAGGSGGSGLGGVLLGEGHGDEEREDEGGLAVDLERKKNLDVDVSLFVETCVPPPRHAYSCFGEGHGDEEGENEGGLAVDLDGIEIMFIHMQTLLEYPYMEMLEG